MSASLFRQQYQIANVLGSPPITYRSDTFASTWWRHQMETLSGLLAICVGNSPVTGEFPAQRPVTRSFDVFFDLRLNKWVSKQLRDWWFETPSRPLWRYCNESMTNQCRSKDLCYLVMSHFQQLVSTTDDIGTEGSGFKVLVLWSDGFWQETLWRFWTVGRIWSPLIGKL